MMFRTNLFLQLLFFLTACNGPKSPTPPNSPPAISNPEVKVTEPQDFDPYFKPTVTDHSKYGPTSITRNVLQDRSGNIWLATWEGIIRYDGTTFTNFTNQNYLRKFHVFSALEDRDGNLWFGTIGAGIYRYDGKTFTNITQKDGLAHDKQGCFHQDRNGKIWIGTMGGISVYDGQAYRNITTTDGLPDNDVNSIIEDRAGNMWIGSRGPLCAYDGEKFTVLRKEGTLITPTRENGYAGGFFNVRCVTEDREGNVWFGGNDGLWRYGADGLRQFAKEFTGYVFEDSRGNIWTSSEAVSGAGEWRVSRYTPESLNRNEATPDVVLQKRDMFFGITEDTNGHIWIGSLNGVGRYAGGKFDWFRADQD
jgi:ligand-binding sensor domain-containing protein